MYKLIRPLLFTQDSENIHNKIASLGEFFGNSGLGGMFSLIYGFEDQSLETKFLGVDFKNPVGLAAGFDKHAKLLKFLPALGFGYTEIGSISALARDGNPKPRLFRLPIDEGLINRMGLNNIGADAMAEKLHAQNFLLPTGINIVKTHDPNILGDRAIEDFIYSFKKLYSLGSYFVFNISCPNTAEGKTFEDPSTLKILLDEITKAKAEIKTSKPILVKISPDVNFEELDKILEVCETHKIDGYMLTNTAKFRDGLQTSPEIIKAIGNGGLSGKPLRKKAAELIEHAYKQLRRPCLIGLGGIYSAESAYERIKAGASLVQVYTGLIYEGPGLVKKINRGLVELLKRDGFKNISEAVGKDVV